ncbi:eRF1 methyltransferase catalytic subunit MTQ2 [Beauveria bassiana]|uniref:ERF1 methyltransferase catalytic subunit MTQ2 n=1 Tax=Beauveria bassiana TaxID=176275 RepID=A0A2N6NLX2_BEABA|nr:eRF1 methyltransferase catalytic subunit MTQ2 [Beauveria bassiana]
MLPTPDTSHVPYERVYEPAEDSFLLLDTLSSPTECAFLTNRFAHPAPLIVEIGTGSGVVLGFVNAQCQTIFGKSEILTAGIDMNAYACRATVATVKRAAADEQASTEARSGTYLGSSMADLTSCFRPGAVDVLIFNPPYVPTPEMPVQPETFSPEVPAPAAVDPSFDDDSYLLALSYAGGANGMETTDRLLPDLARILSARGCAYVLLCAQNKPDLVKLKIPELLGKGWKAQTVGSSGKTAGWEKLQVLRIWNEAVL